MAHERTPHAVSWSITSNQHHPEWCAPCTNSTVAGTGRGTRRYR